MSNLRQMTLAANAYARAYAFFPPALRYEHDDGFTTVAWDYRQDADGTLSPGPLWEFSDTPTAFWDGAEGSQLSRGRLQYGARKNVRSK